MVNSLRNHPRILGLRAERREKVYPVKEIQQQMEIQRIEKGLHIQEQRGTDIYLSLVMNANEERLNVMEIHHVNDAEISTSNVNMRRIVVAMASRNQRNFVK